MLHSNFCICYHMTVFSHIVFPLLSNFCLPTRTPVTLDYKPTLFQHDLILINYIYNDTISN